jgi:hypothetical protein
MSAVVVPAAAIFERLRACGFLERSPSSVRGHEIVFERAHVEDSRFKVLVYTSVSRGASRARAIGKDAIRVVAIFEDSDSSRGIAKLPRVHRTGTIDGVLERMVARAREAYAALSRARPRRDVRCTAPLLADGNDRRTLAQIFDAAQQKHHPGSRVLGAPLRLLDGPERDDEIDEP